MLISAEEVKKHLNLFNIKIEGALHIGAHDCEELPVYQTLGLPPSDVIWVDAIEEKVAKNLARGIPNVYHAAVADQDDKEVTFYRTVNDQSSSILPLESHLKHYPWITVSSETKMNTITIDSFLKKNGISPEKLHFWNFDIQGAELLALKGASNAIQYARVIYLEVNKEHLYKDCALIEEIDAFLNAHKFIRVETKFVDQGWGDALYVRV
jgi:FkbM family methyltransferase